MDDNQGSRPEPCWEDRPGGNGGLYIPILRPSLKGSLSGIILCEHLIGCWTHWGPKGETACIEQREHCPGCKLGWKRQWAGYVSVWQNERRQYAIFQVTHYTLRECPRLDDPSLDLRGLDIRIFRIGNWSNAPISATLGTTRYLTRLPPDISRKHALLRKWGLFTDEDNDQGGLGVPPTDPPTVPYQPGKRKANPSPNPNEPKHRRPG